MPRRTRSAPHFEHTLVDLEDRVNKSLIDSCKADACVDRFLVRVHRLNPSILEQVKCRYSYAYRTGNPAKAQEALEWNGEGAEELREIASELRDNLNRLRPGYVEEGTDILTNKRVFRRMESRWKAIGSRVVWDRDYLQQTSDKDSPLEDNEKPEGMETDDVKREDAEAEDTKTEDRPKKKLRADVCGRKGLAHPDACIMDRLLDTLGAARVATAEEKSTGASSLVTGSFMQACRQLRYAIESETFWTYFPRVQVVHWGAEHDSTAQKLTLPVPSETNHSSIHGPQSLLDACQPASFGRGGQDILDPEYRRAGKLDTDRFLTSFHPADFGIIELIEQILLPGISSGTENRLQFRKLKAELYKLNVYSGPSGLFRKHVDTPRSEHQIGSLVVCLPCEFEGGNLTVQHHGQETNFDWSRQSSSSIQWAAFYSDCEHEIKTIKSGHRITLTYNLYVREMPGAILAPIRPVLDPQTLPLYGLIESLLTTPGFMNDGGVIGVFCCHAYPHSSGLAELLLPRALKGADLVVYAVFEALGIDVSILPILEPQEDSVGFDVPEESGPEQGPDSEEDSDSDGEYWSQRCYNRSGPQKYLKEGKEYPLKYSELYPWKSSNGLLDVDQHWKRLLLTREVHDMKDAFAFGKKYHLPKKPNSIHRAGRARVAPRLQRYFNTDRGEEDLKQVTNDVWPSYTLPGITWISKPKHREMAFSHISYGNEAGIGTCYSCAAILAAIPPFSQRCHSGKMK
ncbi:2OG-Fe(II) oxygenase [Aspergillus neoniger CBS 115656]|uniref:Fe2OG dioxygenase domain-containing protein n=1 Tax=Aspergillus neoniger (strain CBS 115656) TaxID=1448310 RepID=A0A318Z2K6_ASPNB|nr:hypothetical protein BO87DRAFT_461622 [Aspergillus neoniger CBS 115656]PYH31272.1 hypothetical protein BO87DRAFT_461622 [Aspergillus neoniger CBS 115656]